MNSPAKLSDVMCMNLKTVLLEPVLIIVAADVRRLTFETDPAHFRGKFEPPHVGCYRENEF